MTRHIHLDVTGGIAGDMFLAAMLSAFPDLSQSLDEDLAAAGLDGKVRVDRKQVREKGFAALHVDVEVLEKEQSLKTWTSIRQEIEQSSLRPEVKAGAIAIFTLLAEVEALCHDIPAENVHFHELADWDSIADIIGAASVIEHTGADTWSASLLPLGGGTARTQHGRVAVPAPATVKLLEGFEFVDDGGKGERITPTGAAILKYLSPSQTALGPRGKLSASGMGAGTMQIEGIPNILRVLCFEKAPGSGEPVNLIRFEIDDMTPEELAISLDRLRTEVGVLDVSHVVAVGKKGRSMFSVAVMTRPEACDQIVERCFEETSTIGLRVETVARHVLPRSAAVTGETRSKIVERPGGKTAKAESDDLAGLKSLGARRARAREVEAVDE